MNQDRDRLERALVELDAELAELGSVDPQLRQRLERTLADLRTALDETSRPATQTQPGMVQRLSESARNFEETHPNLSGMIGSVIDALGRMGI